MQIMYVPTVVAGIYEYNISTSSRLGATHNRIVAMTLNTILLFCFMVKIVSKEWKENLFGDCCVAVLEQ